MSPGQPGFDRRCEWGERGVAALAPGSDVVVVVDVLSFSTAVEVASSRGARVHPCRHGDDSARRLAASLGALLAGPRGRARFSLSPVSLLGLPRGATLVLPSPNGSTLSLGTGSTPTLAGCLRNARAVAQAAREIGSRVAVVPAGERWPDGSLRPCFEDWVGAGAILHHLPGSASPEASAAIAAFHDAERDLGARLRRCVEGRWLVDRGYESDVALAAELDASRCVPILEDGAYGARAGMRAAGDPARRS